MEKLISSTDLYESLSKKFDRETAKTLTDFARLTIEEKYQFTKEGLATKDFVSKEIAIAKPTSLNGL